MHFYNDSLLIMFQFLSYPCKEHMKLQAIILKVEQCKPISSLQSDQVRPSFYLFPEEKDEKVSRMNCSVNNLQIFTTVLSFQ